jgi:uncharacterized repeat protein (TIGR03987 family)
MNTLLIAGSIIVTLALISYSIAIITEQRTGIISRRVLIFLSLGLVFDITATVLMILGSRNNPFTFHGILGYSALAVMIAETYLIWKIFMMNGINVKVARPAHLYSRYAYTWWVIAYITGALLVALK